MSQQGLVLPTLRGSRWDKKGASLNSESLDWPRVGLYCRQDHELWLLGSYSVSQAVLEERNEVHWGWDLRFRSGDGRLVRLQPNATRPAHDSQELVGNRAMDRKRQRQLMSEAAIAGDHDQVSKLADELDQIRVRTPLHCPTCRIRRVYRNETVQRSLSQIWAEGFSELPLREFTARVQRGA